MWSGFAAAFLLSAHPQDPPLLRFASAVSIELLSAAWPALLRILAAAIAVALVSSAVLASFTRRDEEERASLALLFAALGVWAVPLAHLAGRGWLLAIPSAFLLGTAAGRLAARRQAPVDEPVDSSDLNGPAPRFSTGLSDIAAKSALWPCVAAAAAEFGAFLLLGGNPTSGSAAALAGGFVLGAAAAPALHPAPLPFPLRGRLRIAFGVLTALAVTTTFTLRLPSGPSAPDSASASGGAGGGRSDKDRISGAVLMGKPVRVVTLTAPPPAVRSRAGPVRGHRPKQRLSIEFSGVYWVFSPPSRSPSRGSLILHESPLDYRFSIPEGAWILMEARQQLPYDLDPACCSHLEMEVFNADIQPKSIALEVELAAGDSRKAERLSLGRQRVSGRGLQTLVYPIPPFHSLTKARLIVIDFDLDRRRHHRSANLEIRRFALVPAQ